MTVDFKAMYWDFVEEQTDEGNKTIIHIGGKTKKGKTVYIKVHDFKPGVYLELPELPHGRSWKKYHMKKIFEYFKAVMRSNGPVAYEFYIKKSLYFGEKKYVLYMAFPNHNAGRFLSKICAKKISIGGLGTFPNFKVHEYNIDPIIKFTAMNGIKLAGWIRAVKSDVEEIDDEDDDDTFSSADIEFNTHWTSVIPIDTPENVFVPPTFFSFDIECNSKNPNSKLPDPENIMNCVFQVAIVCGTIGKPESTWEKRLLTLFDPLPIPGTEVLTFDSERELLLGFTEIVQKMDPDIFIGYNIMKFDWQYMITRAKKLGVYPRFMRLSRLNEKAELKTKVWESAAYGKQEFEYPNCHGRTNVDVLLEIERNYRLPTYSLNAVSEHFLKDKKDDITPRQLFMLFKLTNDLLPLIRKKERTELSTIQSMVKEIMPVQKTHGVVKKLRKKLLTCKYEELEEYIRQGLTITGEYCVQDTALPIKLVEKLNLWVTMEQMSNVMNVPITYLHTRGQQIRVLAQVYREVVDSNMFIPSNPDVNTGRYRGAIVIEANKGYYHNVGALDFASLYPTAMIAYNVCYTTILEKDDPTPDSECNIMEWEDHIHCLHDMERKYDEKKMICSHNRHRFKKLKIEYDEKTGIATRKNEGLMPKLERTLLTSRKEVKKEMFRAEATLSMHLGHATKEDIERYRKSGYDIIKEGSLGKNAADMLKITIGVLNAKQLAIKVSCNSCYGVLGSPKGAIPLIEGAATITALGRELIIKGIDRIKKEWPCCRLVYGDTDSCMIIFEGKTLEESFDLCERASVVATHYLKSRVLGEDEFLTIGYGKKLNEISSSSPEFKQLTYDEKIKVLSYEAIPIDLEFENMYGKFLLLTKKRYIAHVVNKKGEKISETKKGVVLARRDNCRYLRSTYAEISSAILEEKSEYDIMNILYKKVNELFTRLIPASQLIIYVGVKSVISYAVKKEVKSARGDVLDTIYIDENKNIISDPIGPLDPRLVYRNLPQALLSLKLLRRGTDVPANTRLEFLYLKNPNATHQGHKAEDFTYYTENRITERLTPDFLHYIEKQLSRPVTEILNVMYEKKPVVYEKIDDAMKRAINMDIDLLKKSRLGKIGTFKLEPVKPYKFKDVSIGYDLYEEIYIPVPERRKVEARIYNFRSLNAKARYVIQSSKKSGINDFDVTDPVDEEVVGICKRFRARDVLNRIYNRYGLTKRPARKPTQHGNSLTATTGVIFTKTYKTIQKGTHGNVVSFQKTETVPPQFLYKIRFGTDVVENIPRNTFSTFYIRDSNIMKDILLSRKYYGDVVESLNELFCPIIIES